MKNTKHFIAFFIALSLFLPIVMPINAVAANSIYEYSGVTIMAGETAPFSPDLSNGVSCTKGEDYSTFTTVNVSDPYFTIDMTDVTWNGKTLAIKYRASADSAIANSYIYPETTAGGWSLSGAGLLEKDKMLCDGEWRLLTYDIYTELLGENESGPTKEQLCATIKSLRIGGVTTESGTVDIAYVGIFDNLAQAENYDAMFCQIYTTVETSYKLEVVPECLSALTREFYNLNDSRVTNNSSLVNTSYKSFGRIRNPLRATWTPNEGSNESKYIVSGSSKYLYLMNDSLVNDNRYANNVPYIFSSDIQPRDNASHFAGFIFNFGYENDGSSNTFFASNQLNGDSSVAKSGIGVSIYPTYMEIYVICLDEETGALSQITESFEFDSSINDGFHTFKAVDNAGGVIRFYLDGKLIASVAYSKDKVPTGKATDYSERYYRQASIYDGDGILKKTTSIALVSYTKAVAMGTCGRAIYIDNVCLEPTGSEKSLLTLDAIEYDKGTKIKATVDYNDTAVKNERIEIYREGKVPGTDAPVDVITMGCALTVQFKTPSAVGNYFAVLMGTSGTESIQYSDTVAFSVYTTVKSAVSIDDASVIAGGTKKITLSIPDNMGISYIAVKVAFDTTYLSLKETCSGSAFEKAVFTASPTLAKNPYIMTWANAENITKSGVMGELTFNVSEDAVGSTELKLEIVEIYSTEETGEIVDVTSQYAAENGVLTFVSQDSETISPLAINGTNLSLQNDITVKFLVKKAEFDAAGYSKPYITAVFAGNTVILEAKEEILYGTQCYSFAFEDIAPQMMNDTISATLYAEIDGITYTGEVFEYKVTSYIYSMLGSSANTEFRTLLVDMLRYGAAAQVYMKHNVDNLADSKLTDEQASWGTSALRELKTVKSIPSKAEEDSAKWVGMTLFLENKVAIRGYFDVNESEGVVVKVTDTNNNVLATLTEDIFEEVTGPEGTPVKTFLFEALDVSQMSKTVCFTVCDSEGNELGGTAVYSIESYAYSMQSSTNTELVELVKAMMMYGDSAYAYVTQ